MPVLSVLLSVLNAESYISEAIQSVLDQTYSSFELIIVNDGSTDKTGEIIRSYAARDSRIVVIDLKHNVGTSKALNEGLNIVRGKYITRQDGDDRSLPHRFEKQIQYIENHPEIGAVGTSVYMMDSSGKRYATDFLMTDPSEIKHTLPDKMCVCGATLLIKKSCFEAAGYYFLGYSEDYDLCLRVNEKFLISSINLPLYEYRVHPESISQSKRFTQIYHKAIALERSLLRQFTEQPPLRFSNFLARDYLRAYVLASASKHSEEALECLHKALSYNPEILHINGELASIVRRYSPITNGAERIQFIGLVFKELIPFNKQLNKLNNRLLAEAYLMQAYQSNELDRQEAYLREAVRRSPRLLLNRGVLKRIINGMFA